MTGSRSRPAIFVGLFLGLLLVSLQGVQGDEELEKVPSEDLCRPYIEKALKDLGTGSLEQSSAEVLAEDDDDDDKKSREEGREDESPTNEQDDDEGTEEAAATSDEEDDKTSQGDQQDDDDDEPQQDAAVQDEADGDDDDDDDDGQTGEQDDGETVEVASNEDDVNDEKKEDTSNDDDAQADESRERETEATEETGSDEQGDEADGEDKQDSGENATENESGEEKGDDKSEEATEDDQTGEVETEEEVKSEEEKADDAGSEEDKTADEAEKSGEEETAGEDEKSGEEENEDDGKSGEDENADDGKSGEENADDEKSGEEKSDTETSAEDSKVDEKSGEEEDAAKEDEKAEGDESEEDKKEEEDDGEDSKDVGESSKEAAEESAEGPKPESGEDDAGSPEEPSETEKTDNEEEEESGEKKSKSRTKRGTSEAGEGENEDDESAEATDSEETEPTPEEDLIQEIEIPENLRPRDHINQLLKLDEENEDKERAIQRVADIVLRDLKRLYDNAIKPLETLYKYRDLSNRHFGDPEIFSKPLVLFMGPWSGGKSSIINYLLDTEYTPTALRTGAEPSPAYFNILMHGEQEEILDGTQLAADWTFSGLQKFGQGMLDRLRGLKLNSKLLEKVNIVEIPGILEIRKQVQRLFPFNDACQWFIDRADIIFLVYDPSKLDVGPETEAILDQLKGREYQTRIILNKADQVKPEELMRVQGALIWNISPLMSSAEPPIMYSTSLWSLPYEAGAPTRLLYAQERAFLRDLRSAIDKRVEHKIASARRFAVRVRNHAKMVDCYLTTYYNHKTFFGNKKDISDKIVENPQDYHIYEGLSTLTNISRYDLPDPDVYRDFFRLNSLYDFPLLSSTCTYFRGCPINRLDVAIAYDLPELVGKYKKSVEAALHESEADSPPS